MNGRSATRARDPRRSRRQGDRRDRREAELPRLQTLYERGIANGVPVEMLGSARQLREIEPHAARAPRDPLAADRDRRLREVCAAMARELTARGVVDRDRRRGDVDPRGAARDRRSSRARAGRARSASSTAPGSTPTWSRGWPARGRRPDHPVPRRVLHDPAGAPATSSAGSSIRCPIPSSRSSASTSRARSTARSRPAPTRSWPSRARATDSAACSPRRARGHARLPRVLEHGPPLLADGQLRDVPLAQQGRVRAGAAAARARARAPRTSRRGGAGRARPGREPRRLAGRRLPHQSPTADAVHVLNAPSPGATASLAIGRHIAGLAVEASAEVARRH